MTDKFDQKPMPERIYIQNPFSSGNATSGTWFTDNRKTDKTEYIRADLAIPCADVAYLVTKEQAREALEEIRRVPLRNYEIIRALLEAASK